MKPDLQRCSLREWTSQGRQKIAGIRGIALIECLIYMGVFSVLLSLSFGAYWRFELRSRRLQQGAEDIVQALQAGERWRQDIRLAVAPLRFEKNNEVATLRIPQKDGEVSYVFEGSAVKRRRGDGAFVAMVTNVLSSDTQLEQRERVNAWRWEFELKSREKVPKVRPIFSFQAVAPPLQK